MPRGKESKTPAIVEHGGFKIGDRVKMTAPACPETPGVIVKIAPDRLAGKEISFHISVKNEGNRKSASPEMWGPIYLGEFVKV